MSVAEGRPDVAADYMWHHATVRTETDIFGFSIATRQGECPSSQLVGYLNDSASGKHTPPEPGEPLALLTNARVLGIDAGHVDSTLEIRPVRPEAALTLSRTAFAGMEQVRLGDVQKRKD